ncbi:MAG: ABC transporter permease [Clostridiales bacterium]|nr:ABC transporter permease [Clostridiales bacterium]
MKSFIAFFKKEMLEGIRSSKLLILGLLFLLFGIMNPAIAKLTPWMFELLSESLEGSGLTVTEVTVDALTSWTQFFKNIPIALIVFVVMYSSTFTREYESGTLVLMLTKGLSRYKVVLAKAANMILLWSAAYWFCFGVTWAYNEYFWDNSIAVGLVSATVNWWLFGLFVISVMVLFSTLFKSNIVVLLATGGSVLVCYVVSLLPKVTSFIPTALMNSAALLVGAESADIYVKTIIITLTVCIACIALSIPIMNKRKL